jgi:sigma-B regulation protein RsbU (phosphoserine phosphatase)
MEKNMEPKSGGPRKAVDSTVVRQLLECRARVKDNEVTNQLLQELVEKYAASEKRLKQLNRELISKQQRIDEDLVAAGEIQRSLLPHKAAIPEAFDIAWHFEPCEKIGGDIFNLVRLDEKRWALYMIDVSGHGVSAAMVAVSVFQSLRPQGGIVTRRSKREPRKRTPRLPGGVLELLDGEYPFARFDNFFTITYIMIDTETGQLTTSCAGHPPPVILRASGEIERLPSGGPPIGTSDLRDGEDLLVAFQEDRNQLAAGDKLVIYSDGVSEYQNEQGELFGAERLQRILRNMPVQPAQEVVEAVYRTVMEFGRKARPKDDFTIVALGLNRPISAGGP